MGRSAAFAPVRRSPPPVPLKTRSAAPFDVATTFCAELLVFIPAVPKSLTALRATVAGRISRARLGVAEGDCPATLGGGSVKRMWPSDPTALLVAGDPEVQGPRAEMAMRDEART